MTKKTCFMIHPFVDPYNKRFDAIYEPAIRHAGLIPYRAGGASVEIITDDIEESIRNAHICFADITEDNPNVWYEVGFAYACRKSVVMVCNKTERKDKGLPFDIRVKNVIFYEDGVDSYDLNRGKFAQKITDQAKAKAKKVDSASVATVQQPKNSDNPLTTIERKILKIIFFNKLEFNRSMYYEDIASKFPDTRKKRVLISLDRMEFAGYINKDIDIYDFDDNTRYSYSPTEKGRLWCHEN